MFSFCIARGDYAPIVDFGALNFGAPAAERDINQGLSAYFVESSAFHRVEAGSKKIVLGNRGAGKSAIFKVVAERQRKAGSIVIELAPEDYSYEMLSDVMAGEAEGSWAKLGAYAVAWKYLILILVMKAVTSEGPKLKRGGAADIYRYLRDNHEGGQVSKLGALISYLKRMEAVKLGPIEASVKTRELQRLYKLDEVAPLLGCLTEVLERQRVYVLVDELDRGWDASEDAKAFVAGLFQACATINDVSPNLRVYMSLRQELYDSIPELYEDAQKYRDLIEVIAWEEPSLLQLMANRIRYSVPELRSASDERCWTSVFSETLEYRKNKSFNYIVDRTLYRPREIIAFATQAAEAAMDGGGGSFPIDYSVLSEAEIQYSEARARDIAAEYRFQYPGLLSVFEVFRGGVYTMERETLEDTCLSLALGETPTSEEAATWVLDEDPEKLIEALWRVGFLRAQAVGGVKARRRSGSQYVGPHQVSNLNLKTLSRFQVHPMFRSFLGMKEAKGLVE
jgi:hypothetical protein